MQTIGLTKLLAGSIRLTSSHTATDRAYKQNWECRSKCSRKRLRPRVQFEVNNQGTQMQRGRGMDSH